MNDDGLEEIWADEWYEEEEATRVKRVVAFLVGMWEWRSDYVRCYLTLDENLAHANGARLVARMFRRQPLADPHRFGDRDG